MLTFAPGAAAGTTITLGNTFTPGQRVTYQAPDPTSFAPDRTVTDPDGTVRTVTGAVDVGACPDKDHCYLRDTSANTIMVSPITGIPAGGMPIQTRHTFTSGQKVQYLGVDGAVGGLTSGAFYYVIVVDAYRIQLALTRYQATAHTYGCPVAGDPGRTCTDNPVAIPISAPSGGTHQIVPAPVGGLVSGRTYVVTTASSSGFGLADIASYAADGTAVAGTPVTFSTTETTTIAGKGTFVDTVVFGTQSIWAAGLHLTPACLTNGCSGPTDELRIDLTSVGSGTYGLYQGDLNPLEPAPPAPVSLRTLNPPPGDGESRSSAAGGGGGVLAVGVPTANLSSSPTALAYLAGSVTAGGDVTVTSNVETSNTSWVTNGSGGVIAVGKVEASVTVNAKSTALIGSLVTPGAAITGDSAVAQVAGAGAGVSAGGNVAVLASSSHYSTDHGSSSGGGLVGGYTAGANTTITDRTAAATGAGAQITGDTVRVNAHSGGAHFLYTHAVMGALFGGTNTFPNYTLTSSDIALLDGIASSGGSITGRYGVDVRAFHDALDANLDDHSACYCIGPSLHSGGATVSVTSAVYGHQGVVIHAGPRLIRGVNTSANAPASPLVTLPGQPNAAHLVLYVQAENPSRVESTDGGITQSRTIDWNSDVVVNSGPAPYLLIDTQGKVVRAVNVTVNGVANPNIGTTYSGTITVGDIRNTGSGDIWMTSDNGTITGGCAASPAPGTHCWGTFTFHENFSTVTLLNNSTFDLVVQDIDVINRTGQPHVTLATSNTPSDPMHFDIVQDATPSLVVIDNTGDSDITLRGTITNPLGATWVHATFGSILAGTSRGVPVSGTDAHTTLVQSNIVHLDAERGSIGSLGTGGNRLSVDAVQYAGHDLSLSATGGVDVRLDLRTWLRDPAIPDPAVAGNPAYVVHIDSLVAGNDLDVVLRATLWGTGRTGLPGVNVINQHNGTFTGTYYSYYHPDTVNCVTTPTAEDCLFAVAVTGGNSHAVASTYDFATLSSGSGTGTANGSVTVAAANDAPGATRINVIGLVAVHGNGNVNVDTNGFITLTATAAATIARRVVVAQALSPIDPAFVMTADVTLPFGPNADLRLGLVRSTDDDVILSSPASIVDAPVGTALPPVIGDAAADVVGATITMTAGTGGPGSIGTDTNFVEIDSSYARYGVLRADAAGVIRITEVPSIPAGAYAAANPTMAGDLHVDTVTTCVRGALTTCADVTLTTTAGSILDGHNAGLGGTTVNVTGNSIDLLALGGSIGRFTSAATGVFTGDLKVDSAKGSGCQETYSLLWFRASAADRAVTATCDIAASADANIYLTELDGPAAVVLARTQAGDIRLTTTETALEGNDIIVVHSGGTLVREPVSPSLVPNVQVVPRGLVQAQNGNVLLLSADDVVTDPSAQILATTRAGDPGTGNTTDPNAPRTTTGNIEIHGDWHPGVTDATANEGTVIVLRGEITPGAGGLTRVHGNADDDQITFDQTLLGGNTRAYGSAVAAAPGAFAPAGDGSDTLTVYLLATMPVAGTTLTLDGQDGTDSYVIWTHGSAGGAFHYVVNVLDSGAPARGVDTLEVHGADSLLNGINPATGAPWTTDDIFLLRSSSSIPGESAARPSVYCGTTPTGGCTNRAGYVSVLHPTLGSPDPLDVTRTSGYDGVVERINYDNAVNGRFAVLGHGGNDHFAVDDNVAVATLDGGAGNDSFQIGQVYGMRRDDAHSGLSPPDWFPTIATTRGYLSTGSSAPIVAQGGSGDDSFTVYSNHAALRLEGNDGNDLFAVQAFALAKTRADGSIIMGPLFTGSVTINSATSTITRSTGSFIADGFAVGQTLVVKGAGATNDNRTTTAYVISAVTATTITLARTLTTLPPLGQSGAFTVSLSSGPLARSGLTISAAGSSSTITRTDGGSFLTDGFLVGQTVALAGAGSNDNLAGVPYVITAVTASTLTVSSVLTAGTYAGATVSGVLPSPMLTSGFSTAAQTDIRTGGGDNQVQYNINAPVSVDGGTGFNKLVVLGTEFADHIVVTATAIYGAGIQVAFRNISVVEVDALQGDDTIDVLSTALGVATRVLGGLGSDVINVAGDVVGDVVSRDVNGSSSTINHLVISSDADYNNIVAAGLNVSVARPSQGVVLISESGGFSAVRRLTGTSMIGSVDSYAVRLAKAPTSDVWITVSAAASPLEQRPGAGGLVGDTLYVCTTSAAVCATSAGYFHTVYDEFGVGHLVPNRAAVLLFTTATWQSLQTVWFAAATDTMPQGTIVMAISHTVISADPVFAGAVVRNVEVTVHDNLTPGVVVTQRDGAAPDTDTTVIKGTPTTRLTDTFTIEPPSRPSGTVTYVLTPSDSRILLSSSDLRFTLGPVVGGVQTYKVTICVVCAAGVSAWDVPVLITVTAVDNFLVQDPHHTLVAIAVATADVGRDTTYDGVTGVARRPRPRRQLARCLRQAERWLHGRQRARRRHARHDRQLHRAAAQAPQRHRQRRDRQRRADVGRHRPDLRRRHPRQGLPRPRRPARGQGAVPRRHHHLRLHHHPRLRLRARQLPPRRLPGRPEAAPDGGRRLEQHGRHGIHDRVGDRGRHHPHRRAAGRRHVRRCEPAAGGPVRSLHRWSHVGRRREGADAHRRHQLARQRLPRGAARPDRRGRRHLQDPVRLRDEPREALLHDRADDGERDRDGHAVCRRRDLRRDELVGADHRHRRRRRRLPAPRRPGRPHRLPEDAAPALRHPRTAPGRRRHGRAAARSHVRRHRPLRAQHAALRHRPAALGGASGRRAQHLQRRQPRGPHRRADEHRPHRLRDGPGRHLPGHHGLR